MRKFSLLVVTAAAVLLTAVLAVTVQADGTQAQQVPPPYAGMKNPFQWNDTSAQDAGKKVYQGSCLGCHGATGGNVKQSDFSPTDFPGKLEKQPDFYMWRLSEGDLSKGMPPFKSSLTEEQRWQVLTYMWSLSKAAPPAEKPSEGQPPKETKATIVLTVPPSGKSGMPLMLSAAVRDDQGQPIKSANVQFLVKVDFFASGLMEIGQADTDDRGTAVFQYTPRVSGITEVVARYQTIEGGAKVNLAPADRPFYHPEVGIRFPAPGPEVVIGPQTAMEPGPMGEAPTFAFRLPEGILSWLWALAGIIALIWVTYFRVLRRVLAIAAEKPVRGVNTRFIPTAGMIFVIMVGILLVLMILTGPYSHSHLGP